MARLRDASMAVAIAGGAVADGLLDDPTDSHPAPATLGEAVARRPLTRSVAVRRAGENASDAPLGEALR